MEEKQKKGKKRSVKTVSDEESRTEVCIEDKGTKKEGKKSKTERDGESQFAFGASVESVVENQMTMKEKKSCQELPIGYVCKACGKCDDHAIYNCPLKVSKKINKVTKSNQTKANLPPQAENELNTLYITGLPFDMTTGKLLQMLKTGGATDISPKDVKLIPFPDNLKKCKGIAFVKCSNELDIIRCMELDGTEMGTKKLVIQRVSPQSSSKTTQKRPQTDSHRCYRCGKAHPPSECPNPRICYRCKKTDHLSSNCPMKKNLT